MLKRLSIFVLLFVFSLQVNAGELPQGFKKIKTLGGITEYQLESNGLTVLLMEDHTAPVLTYMVTFNVGSRNEVTGTTGATHILEHLMFKGTPKYNKANGGHLDATLGNIGAQLNATTWLDRTNYYESIPSEYLELAVDIESDRMRNLYLKKEDKESEMTVVRNEYERGQNSPFSALSTEIWATAFQAHPYHHSTIGWKSDIEKAPIKKFKDFYNTFYWPNNATVTVIGDFETEKTLSLIKKYYGSITKSPHEIPQLYTEEPEQQGPRRLILKRAGQLGVVGVGFKIPEGSHEDTYALSVLNNILSEGKTSRFYKALIDKNIAVDVFNFQFAFRDPSLFAPYIFLAPGVKHEDAEAKLWEEINKIKDAGVTTDEVNRAQSQISAATAFGRDGSFSVASQINESIAMGDWTTYVTYVDNINKVTAADVQSVVKKYFVEDQSTTGYFVPKVPGADKASAPKSSRSEMMGIENYKENNETVGHTTVPAAASLPSSSSIADIVKRETVAGIDLLVAKTGVKDVVTIRGSFYAGDILSPNSNSSVADFVGSMLDKGTKNFDKFALAEKLENLGASISFSTGTHKLNIRAKCLTKDVNVVIGLIAEQLRNPVFSAEELEKLKKQKEGGLKRQLENTGARAAEKFSQIAFSKNHPNYSTTIEQLLKDVQGVTVKDLKAFHKKYYGPKSMKLVFVGDIDKNALTASVKKNFSGWKGGVDYKSYKNESKASSGKTEIVFMEEKTSATLMIGQKTGMKKTDDDYVALRVANEAFGGGSFTARLMSTIRDEEGLTYGIYAGFDGDIFSDGSWAIQGSFSPDLLKQGMSSTMRELKKWVDSGITEDELKNTVSRLKGSYKVSLATTGGLAAQLLAFVERGFDVDYMDKYSEELDDVDLDDANAAIKKYINPDKVITVIAGTVEDKDLASR